MRKIRTDLSKLKPAKAVEFLSADGAKNEDCDKAIEAIKAVMEADKNILALSAPQIGIDLRIFCLKFNDAIKTFINPVITKKNKFVTAPETCPSYPGKEILISRPTDVSAVYYSEGYKYEDNKFVNMAARLFDQQYQFLDGVMPDELGLISDPSTDGSLYDLSDEEFAEVADYYKKYIETKSKVYNSAENMDEATAKEYRQLKFSESVINDRIQVVDAEPKYNRATRRALKKQSKGSK